MPSKTIVATVTLHVPGPTFRPFVFTDSGTIKSGKYDVVGVAPGVPVKLDADEADRLIKRGVAEEYVPPAPTATAVVDAAKE